MTCMTTKQKFDCDEPDVVVLANGRYAYKVKCPWEGKAGKELYAFKFCSAAAHARFKGKCEAMQEQQEAPDETDELVVPNETSNDSDEQTEAPEEA